MILMGNDLFLWFRIKITSFVHGLSLSVPARSLVPQAESTAAPDNGGMSNTEKHPAAFSLEPAAPHCENDGRVELLNPRAVPLGGFQSITVHRTIPQRQRSFIGAWCFSDHYGLDCVQPGGGMDVAPHPHTCLQTVSWLFDGEIDHHDTAGNHAVVLPGEANFMTAGAGIAHSEVSTQSTRTLHGVQLWTALPDAARFTTPRFDHYVPDTVNLAAAHARVFVGDLFGESSPVSTFTPLLGAEVRLAAGKTLTIETNPEFEHGLLLDTGTIELEGVDITPTKMAYTGIGERTLRVENTGNTEARFILLGGEPFDESIVMWWNFIGRNTEEIRQFRTEWMDAGPRFGTEHGYIGHDPSGELRIDAPELTSMRLKPRTNPAPIARPQLNN